MISPERDIPMLRQVRNSRFVSHAQLFQFMKLGGFDHDRDSFNWRLRRLRKAQHIEVCSNTHGAGSAVYRISRNGLILLEHYGNFATVLNSNTEHLPHLAQVFHALELNEVHLALARNNLLAAWQSEVEVASYNTISQFPFGKDYDAIVDVWLDDRQARFALEYERSLKSQRHYERIRSALNAECQVECILYLASGNELLVPLVHEFAAVKKRIGFAGASTFLRDLLDTPVVGLGSITRPFRQLLS